MPSPANKTVEPQIILCPYCGHVQTVPESAAVPDQCDECRGLFEPLSRRATQIAMGPWYIRDKKSPFRPGCSYEVIQKMIKAGRIRPTTVMRGPSTKQFWSVARNVPGISHLLGYCHQCQAKVQPQDKTCHACGAKFEEPKERNELGLHYRTAAEAAAAQKALDREIAAIAGGAPPSSGGSGISQAINPEPGAGLLDEVLGTGMKGGSPLLNFGSSAPASPPPAPGGLAARPAAAATAAPPAWGARPAASPPVAPPTAQPNFAAGFGAAPPAPAGFAARPAAAPRAVDAFSLAGEMDDTGMDAVQRKQRNVGLMTWLLVGFNVLLVVVVIALVVLNKGKPADSQPDAPKKPGSSPTSRDSRPAEPPRIAANTPARPATVDPAPRQPVDPAPVPGDVTPKPADPTTPANPADPKPSVGNTKVAPPIAMVAPAEPPADAQPDPAEKERFDEMVELLKSARAKLDAKDLEGTLHLLVMVSENYPTKWHPADLAQRIAEFKKEVDRRKRAKFFGTSTE